MVNRQPLSPEPAAFDPTGPLPAGTTLLEASAGTGKTYTIGALVTRFIAEGVATLPQMLVVTFGRAASQEMRERVREHLVMAERALTDPAAATASDDQVIRLLANADRDEVAARRRRLAEALADFDAATIATTHQFCQQVLVGLGVAGDSEPGAVLVEDLDDLTVEVAGDLYLRAFAVTDLPARFTHADALALARAAIGDPQARLDPEDAATGSDAYWRRWFAGKVRDELDRRKRRLGVLSFDDLLSRVAGALATADPAARQRMRDRWKVVLVDEFQDTDPVQWEVLRGAFAGESTLVLIGDPKQAVYAFRGGDVVTYLDAARTAGTQSTLSRNWRSDRPLVEALHALIGGVELGDPDIVVRPVSAMAPAGRLIGAPCSDPVRLRVVTRRQLGSTGVPAVATARRFIARDLAADIARLLASGARFDGTVVGPGDIAVLVGTHAQGALIADQLAALEIPSVVAGPGSVYATDAGQDWLTLLEALEQPHRASLVRAAARTPFLGWTAAGLDAGGERATDELSALLRGWGSLLASRGVAAVLEAATAERGLWARLLGERDGERRLTDVRHVGQGLHAAALDDGLGPAALVEWLRRRRSEAAAERSDDRARRLDSDAAAVQISTLHASKGLEYPVVYLPFVCDRYVGTDDMPRLHDAAGTRILDVGGPGGPGRADRVAQSAAEAAGESLRLLYVGLTRAKSQVVTWWAPSKNAQAAPLHRVLFGRRPDTGRLLDVVPVPTDEVARRTLARIADLGALALEAADPGNPPVASPQRVDRAAPAVARFDRRLDLAWHRASYSSMTAAAGHGQPPGVSSEAETAERDDETLSTAAEISSGGESAAIEGSWPRSPMADLPSGTAFGTLVHAILENVDTDSPDLAGELVVHCTEQLTRHPVDATAGPLAAALLPVLHTSLGPIADDLTLAALSPRDRLAELTFELPLMGGDRPNGTVTLGEVARLLRRHLPAADPLAGYPDQLAVPELADTPLRGYLTGSIDAVLRLPGPRYLIVDYKTNWLGDPSDPDLSAWHYRPAAMATAMIGSHYPLQALLYSVALHRFLRWRQPGYDIERHLGGALYLFVRGMCGPETPTVGGSPCGVFGWRPGAALVDELSVLLDGGAR